VPAADGGKDDYLMDHTSLVYLMGPDGKFLTAFAPNFSPQDMELGIKRFL
jgi:protein SCO1/2